MRRPRAPQRLAMADDVLRNTGQVDDAAEQGRRTAPAVPAHWRQRSMADDLFSGLPAQGNAAPRDGLSRSPALEQNTLMNANEAAVPSPDAAARVIVYEQPLNERMRNFLRLDFLYQQAVHHHTQSDPWSTRAAVSALLEILAITAARRRARRGAEGARAADGACSPRINTRPGVDTARLRMLLTKLHRMREELSDRRRAVHAEAARLGVPQRDQAPQHHPGRHLRVRPAGLHALAQPARRSARRRLRALARGDPAARRRGRASCCG